MAPSFSQGKAAVFLAISHARRSTNRFQAGRTIPHNILQDILQCTMRSPSSFNLQPTQIVMVQKQETKDALARKAMLGAGNQYRVRDCSALAVFLADLEAGRRIQRIQDLEKEWGQRHPNYTAMMPLASSFLLGEGHAAHLAKNMAASLISPLKPMPQIESTTEWSYKNTSLFVQSYLLAATSHDLSTTPMEGFDPRHTKEVLRIPDRYSIPMVVATGYAYEGEPADLKTPRLALEEMVFSDAFGVPFGSSLPVQTEKDEEEDPVVANTSWKEA